MLLTSQLRRAAVSPWTPVVLAVIAVCFPILYHALRAAAGSWVPTGDDAYFTVRSRDVLTEHHPLLGAWSSGSVDLTEPINNLGPTQLDLMAPFTRRFPMGGTAISVAVTNIASIVAIAWLLARLAGRRAVLGGLVAIGLLTWTMGSEMLITPRQHQYLVLPYLCLLVAAWAVAAGDRRAIVPAVAAGSLTAQTHLSYPVLVAALAAVMVAGHVRSMRSGRTLGGRRDVVAGAVLAVLLWSQTLIDQVAGSGNLGAVLFGSGGAGRAGLWTGIRLVAGVLISPVPFVRRGYARDDTEVMLADWWQLVLFAVLLAAGCVVALRLARRSWRQASGVVVGIVAVVAGIVDAAMLPRTQFGLAIMNYRWLWSTGAFLLMLALVHVVIHTERLHRVRDGSVRGALVVCALLGLYNMPRSVQHPEPDRYLREQRAVATALGQLTTADLPEPLVIDESEMYFGHPYTYPVLVALQEMDVDFRFVSPLQERRFGAGRVVDGTEVATLRLVAGDPALQLDGDPRVVASVSGLVPVVILVDDLGDAGAGGGS